jgi:hypothetical protein
MEIQQSIAERYRAEAVRLRREAMRVNSEAVRLQMLNIARRYEDLAAIVEKLPQRLD